MRISIACPRCDGVGCESCDGGEFEVECPRRFVSDIANEANLVSMCSGGLLPVAGGLLDQSAWFLDFHQRLTSEQAKAEREQMERRSGE